MKSLIAITTCKRLLEVKKNIIPYLQFCLSNKDFHFILSLDGKDDDYLAFSKEFNIPLIYSEKREGVGLSKNRVLKHMPNYNYYFFIEDDVELIDANIFELHLRLVKKYNIHHTCLTIHKNHNYQIVDENLIIGFKGSAPFNLFTKEGINKCGGWHTLFSKYKRFGHTEYSYRYFFNKLNPMPFCSLNSDHLKYMFVNDPPHVTNVTMKVNELDLIPEEQAMIDARQSYFPITTLSEFYFNGFNVSIPNLHPDLQKGRYALVKGKEKIKAWGNFYFHKFKVTKNPLLLVGALVLYPNNNLLKHWVKGFFISK